MAVSTESDRYKPGTPSGLMRPALERCTGGADILSSGYAQSWSLPCFLARQKIVFVRSGVFWFLSMASIILLTISDCESGKADLLTVRRWLSVPAFDRRENQHIPHSGGAVLPKEKLLGSIFPQVGDRLLESVRQHKTCVVAHVCTRERAIGELLQCPFVWIADNVIVWPVEFENIGLPVTFWLQVRSVAIPRQ